MLEGQPSDLFHFESQRQRMIRKMLGRKFFQQGHQFITDLSPHGLTTATTETHTDINEACFRPSVACSCNLDRVVANTQTPNGQRVHFRCGPVHGRVKRVHIERESGMFDDDVRHAVLFAKEIVHMLSIYGARQCQLSQNKLTLVERLDLVRAFCPC